MRKVPVYLDEKQLRWLIAMMTPHIASKPKHSDHRELCEIYSEISKAHISIKTRQIRDGEYRTADHP